MEIKDLINQITLEEKVDFFFLVVQDILYFQVDDLNLLMIDL